MENPGSKSGQRAKFARDYLEHLMKILRSLDLEAISNVVGLFHQARENGNAIFFMGNGGSAATACHFANDLCVSASPEGRIPFKALSLCANSSLMTCLANDFGYKSVFSRQLRNMMRPGDVAVGISASGNSPNIIEALEFAERNGGISVAIVGFDGGKAKGIARHVIHVKSGKGEFGPVEDTHMVLDHLISAYFAREPVSDESIS